VLDAVPHDTVSLWCASRVFVWPALGQAGGPDPNAEVPGEATVQFLSKASKADVERAVAYFRNTGLFATVTVVKDPQKY
jgi:hypothetical protein